MISRHLACDIIFVSWCFTQSLVLDTQNKITNWFISLREY